MGNINKMHLCKSCQGSHRHLTVGSGCRGIRQIPHWGNTFFCGKKLEIWGITHTYSRGNPLALFQIWLTFMIHFYWKKYLGSNKYEVKINNFWHRLHFRVSVRRGSKRPLGPKDSQDGSAHKAEHISQAHQPIGQTSLLVPPYPPCNYVVWNTHIAYWVC